MKTKVLTKRIDYTKAIGESLSPSEYAMMSLANSQSPTMIFLDHLADIRHLLKPEEEITYAQAFGVYCCSRMRGQEILSSFDRLDINFPEVI